MVCMPQLLCTTPRAKTIRTAVLYTILMFLGSMLLFDTSVVSALASSLLGGVVFALLLWWTDTTATRRRQGAE